MSAETAGSPPDLPEVIELARLLDALRQSTTSEMQAEVWAKMLALRADQVFTIGTVNASLQPMVCSARMRNLPEDALYGFIPTSNLGAYLPDTFFYAGGWAHGNLPACGWSPRLLE